MLQFGLQVGVGLFVFCRQSLKLCRIHVFLHLAQCLSCHVFQHIAHTIKGCTPIYVHGKALGISLPHGGVTLLFQGFHLPLLFLSSAGFLIRLLYLLGIFLGYGILLLLYGSILLQIVCHGKQFLLQGFLVGILDGFASAFLVQGVSLVQGVRLFLGQPVRLCRNACFLVVAFPCRLLLVDCALLCLVVVFYLAELLLQAFLHGVNFFFVILALQRHKFLTHLFLHLLTAFFSRFGIGCILFSPVAVFVRTGFARIIFLLGKFCLFFQLLCLLVIFFLGQVV